MLITKISNKRKGITEVYLQGQENPLILDTFVVKKENLQVKTDILQDEILRLSRLSEMHTALLRAVRLLKFRAHSQKELYDKLKREYSEEAADYAVEQMLKRGYLDDLEYAKNKVRYFNEIKRYSVKRIKTELSLKGVDDEIISLALCDADINGTENLKKIIEKRFTPLPTDEKGKRRMVNYLLRQGYSLSEIFSEISE